jgi:hypothetical protein
MEPFRPLKECMDKYGIVMGEQEESSDEESDDVK